LKGCQNLDKVFKDLMLHISEREQRFSSENNHLLLSKSNSNSNIHMTTKFQGIFKGCVTSSRLDSMLTSEVFEYFNDLDFSQNKLTATRTTDLLLKLCPITNQFSSITTSLRMISNPFHYIIKLTLDDNFFDTTTTHTLIQWLSSPDSVLTHLSLKNCGLGMKMNMKKTKSKSLNSKSNVEKILSCLENPYQSRHSHVMPSLPKGMKSQAYQTPIRNMKIYGNTPSNQPPQDHSKGLRYLDISNNSNLNDEELSEALPYLKSNPHLETFNLSDVKISSYVSESLTLVGNVTFDAFSLQIARIFSDVITSKTNNIMTLVLSNARLGQEGQCFGPIHYAYSSALNTY
jgi:hypothetical protein